MLIRYTKAGEWVLDPFVGSGTTLIECRRLERNGLGIELNEKVANEAEKNIKKVKCASTVTTRIVVGDSTTIDYGQLLTSLGINEVQMILMHPPYHDIIKFSADDRDLSNIIDVQEFLQAFGKVVEQTFRYLAQDRYLIVVIGDKYQQGEWIPLGYYVMQTVMERGYKLKSIVVKNYEQTKGKRDQTQLWRYRALAGGFYIFKHEYIYIFKK
jgi:DNA modification methylase